MIYLDIYNTLKKIKDETKSEYVTITTVQFQNNEEGIRITAFKKGLAWNQEYTQSELEQIKRNSEKAKFDNNAIINMFISRAYFEFRKNDIY